MIRSSWFHLTTPLSALLSFCISLSSFLSCPVDDLHSEIHLPRSRLRKSIKGREASSSPGNVRVLVLIKWSPESLLFNLIHRHRHLLLSEILYVLFTHTICARVGICWERYSFPLSSWVPIFSATVSCHIHRAYVLPPFHFREGKIKSGKESSCPHVPSNLMNN